MSEIKNKGDRLLAGFGNIRGNLKPASPYVAPEGEAVAGNKKLLPQTEELLQQAAAEMATREAETQRLRDAMLAAGVDEDLVSDPEGAAMDHLPEDEQDQFNDAVREHRAFHDELQRDLRELQRSRDALQIRHNETVLPPPMTEETEA